MTYQYACINQNGREVLVYVGFVDDPHRQWSWIFTEPPRFGNDVDVSQATGEDSEEKAYANAEAWIKRQGFRG